MSKDQNDGFEEVPAPKPAAKPAPAKLAGPPAGARVTPQPSGKRTPAPKLPPPVPPEGTVERHWFDHEKEGNPIPAWKHAAAKAMNRWPVGAEVKREDYDAAITQAENIRVQ